MDDDYYVDITGSVTYLCDADGGIETRTYSAGGCSGEYSSSTEKQEDCVEVPSESGADPPYYTTMVCTALAAPPSPASALVKIDFLASQVITGCSYADYASDKDTYNSALQTAVARSCNPLPPAATLGIEGSFVKDIVVAPSTPNQGRRELAQTSLLATYRVTGTVTASGSASSVTSSIMGSLKNAVKTGKFSGYLQEAAASTKPPATGFESAQSSSIKTTLPPSSGGGNSASSSGKSQALSSGAAAGVAFVVIFLVGALGAGFYIYRKRINRGRGINDRAIEMYDTKNAMFGGMGGGGGRFDQGPVHLGNFGDLHQDRSSTGSYGENTGLSINRKDNIPDPMQFTGKRLGGLRSPSGTSGSANL